MNRPENVSSIQQIRLERRLPSYWRVTFDHPPLNIFGPETIPQLNEIVTALETDEHVKMLWGKRRGIWHLRRGSTANDGAPHVAIF